MIISVDTLCGFAPLRYQTVKYFTVIHRKFNAVRSRKSTVQSFKYYTVQFGEKYGHSNITVNRNYYGQRLASKLPVFDRKSYSFF